MIKRLIAGVIAIVAVFGVLHAAPADQRVPTLSRDLLVHPRGPHAHRVIVQGSAPALAAIRALGHVRRGLTGAIALDVTDADLDALSRDPGVAHISADLPVTPDMAVTNQVTEATTVWQGTSGLLGIGATPGYRGAGVGVAVVDSGIAPHAALNDRPIVHVNLVSTEPGVTGDPYGHGTHIAAIIAGNTTAASRITKAYAGGSAPAARLIDVRVLGRSGVGYTSDVIAGIDWAIANRSAYGIRVINLSLGHPVTEPSSTDPLCQAVARAVASGIVVVAAAGNYGRTDAGAPRLGSITSPGNSPFALTVGAFDTHGTLDGSDDTLAPYSSRGPTEYEYVVKPDIVAPGTAIVSAEAFKSYLSTTYPQWHVAGSSTNAYLRLSGTSMATGVVSGGVALLLNAEPTLAPAQVKLALQMGARFMDAGGLNGSGSGRVDFENALKVAQDGLVTNLLDTVSMILGSGSGAAFRDDGTMADRIYGGTGRRLLGLLDLSSLFQSADSGEWGVLNLLGLSNPLATTPANRLLWGEVAGWTDSDVVVWGTNIQSPSGQVVVWGTDDVTDGSVVVWGTSAK